MRSVFQWNLGSRTLELGKRTLIMGIVNVTPDSFSDGGLYLDSSKATDHALQLLDEGADIIDVGGESTRPGASVVTAERSEGEPKEGRERFFRSDNGCELARKRGGRVAARIARGYGTQEAAARCGDLH